MRNSIQSFHKALCTYFTFLPILTLTETRTTPHKGVHKAREEILMANPKPCPNCGCPAGVEPIEGEETLIVGCADCGICGPWASTEEEAIEAWNWLAVLQDGEEVVLEEPTGGKGMIRPSIQITAWKDNGDGSRSPCDLDDPRATDYYVTYPGMLYPADTMTFETKHHAERFARVAHRIFEKGQRFAFSKLRELIGAKGGM